MINIATITVIDLLYSKLFHNPLFIISKKIRIVNGTNMLAKIVKLPKS